MKKYDKHMKYRETEQAKSSDFDKRLESEPFKSKRLDSLLELYRAVKARTHSLAGTRESSGMELRLISGRSIPSNQDEKNALLATSKLG
jgi:hypothetical protein